MKALCKLFAEMPAIDCTALQIKHFSELLSDERPTSDDNLNMQGKVSLHRGWFRITKEFVTADVASFNQLVSKKLAEYPSIPISAEINTLYREGL